MKERPILFSAPMVRAIIAGTKTQTRRAVKPVGNDDGFVILNHGMHDWPYRSDDGDSSFHTVKRGGKLYLDETPHTCPYGKPGDRLWVREAWRTTGDVGRCDDMPPRDLQPHAVWYEADGTAQAYECVGKLRPGMFMPRWASRILLEIAAVRVERLHEISEADAVSEGVCELPGQAAEPGCWWTGDVGAGSKLHGRTPSVAYRLLWELINGPGSLDANPWVWVVEFKRIEGKP